MQPAPEWHVSQWFNTPTPLSLDSLRGRIIVLYAFQMLCPGCVKHSLPQAQRLYQTFQETDLAVVGLHTVFEYHDEMQPPALEAFLRERGITFPVGVDEPSGDGDPLPRTMRAYDMQGTPTLVLIDRQGRRRRQFFGSGEDLLLGALIGMLLAEGTAA